MTANIQFPTGMWELPLFQASAEYAHPRVPLLIARLDARLRRLRQMPSAADESSSRILDGMARLDAQATAWLSQNGHAKAWVKEALARLERLQKAAERGLAAEALRDNLARLTERFDEDVRKFAASLDIGSPDAVLSALHLIRLFVLEHGAMAGSRWRNPYLRRVFRIVDEALDYNSTTDAARYVPVLSWIRHILACRSKRECVYVDVGCAAMQRAPGLVLAGRILREQALCAQVLHGTDVRVPPRSVRMELLAAHQLAIYQCNPVRQVLPRRYDAILLANVHRHLPMVLQRQLFSNLAYSLFEQGLVFVTWRFDSNNSPGICLERRGSSLVLIHQTNVI